MYNPKSNRRNERSGEVEKYFFHQNGATCYHHKFISTIFLPVFINDDNSGITGVPRNIIILQFSIYIIWPTKKWNNDENNVKIIHVFVGAWKQKVSKCIVYIVYLLIEGSDGHHLQFHFREYLYYVVLSGLALLQQ